MRTASLAALVAATALLTGACGGDSPKQPAFAEAFTLFTEGARAMDTGNLDLAAERLEKAVEADPDFADAWCLLGEVYLKRGDAPQAEVTIRKGLAVGPKSSLTKSEAYLYLSDSLLARGENEAALEAADESLLLRPESPAANRRRAEILGRLGRKKEQAESLRAYLEHAPRAPDAESVRRLLESIESE